MAVNLENENKELRRECHKMRLDLEVGEERVKELEEALSPFALYGKALTKFSSGNNLMHTVYKHGDSTLVWAAFDTAINTLK